VLAGLRFIWEKSRAGNRIKKAPESNCDFMGLTFRSFSFVALEMADPGFGGADKRRNRKGTIA
jgi:hypothetical protein